MGDGANERSIICILTDLILIVFIIIIIVNSELFELGSYYQQTIEQQKLRQETSSLSPTPTSTQEKDDDKQLAPVSGNKRSIPEEVDDDHVDKKMKHQNQTI